MKHSWKWRTAAVLAALTLASAVSAQINETAAFRQDGRLYVKFPLATDAKLTTNAQMTVTPVVTDGERQVWLEPVVYTGRTRRKVAERRERLYGSPAVPEDTYGIIVTGRGHRGAVETIPYEDDVPYEKWMAGGRIVLYREMTGCRGDAVLFPPMTVARIPAPVPAELSFVIPADVAKRRSERITAVVHFPQGRYVLLPEFADNRAQLGRIDSLTQRLVGNGYVMIEEVNLEGYASPEDTYEHNSRLAKHRAATIHAYLRENYAIPEELFSQGTVPEDWDSLRRWVAVSALPERERVLEVIDNVADPDARDGLIRRIDGGKTYRKLLNDAYPQLRRVDYVVGYTVRPFTLEQSREIVTTHPEWLSAAEFCRLAASYPEGSPEHERMCALALEYYPDDPCACNNSAAVALRQGDRVAARELLGRCASDPRVQNNLGVAFLAEGDVDEAQRCFEVAAANGSEEAAYNLTYLDDLVCEW